MMMPIMMMMTLTEEETPARNRPAISKGRLRWLYDDDDLWWLHDDDDMIMIMIHDDFHLGANAIASQEMMAGPQKNKIVRLGPNLKRNYITINF